MQIHTDLRIRHIRVRVEVVACDGLDLSHISAGNASVTITKSAARGCKHNEREIASSE